MEVKPLFYELETEAINYKDVRRPILSSTYGNKRTRTNLTQDQLIKFLDNAFTHFRIASVDPALSPIIFDNLVVFSKMEVVNYLYSRIRWIDYVQLQYSAAYVYDDALEQIKFKYIRFVKELMKFPSELKYMSCALGSHLKRANKNTRKMYPVEIRLFREASPHFTKMRELFSKHGLDFTKYDIGIMSDAFMEHHVAGVLFQLHEVNGVNLLGVLSNSNFDNTGTPSTPKIKEVVMREENVKDKFGMMEKRERIYVKYE
jgi:hypothetical protein